VATPSKFPCAILQAGVSSREAELDQLKQQLEEERAAVLQARLDSKRHSWLTNQTLLNLTSIHHATCVCQAGAKHGCLAAD
jgi:hypothetical protein